MVILNLTQHTASAEQLEVGVVDLTGDSLSAVKAMLTFKSVPTLKEVQYRAQGIAFIAKAMNVNHVMIGGAPYLMAPLENELVMVGISYHYSFTERISVETTLPDGSVSKTAVFRHCGFVPEMPYIGGVYDPEDCGN